MLTTRAQSRRRAGASVRRAFTMVEALVVLVILAILVAVIVPQVESRIQDSRGAAMAETLSSLAGAIQEYRADVRRYPPKLEYLTTAPTYGVKDLCSNTVPATYLTYWHGPYLKTVVLSTGIVLEESTVQDSLQQSPAGPYTSTSSGNIVIVVNNVDSAVARQLEAKFDGNSDYTSGTIQYTLVTQREGTLKFFVPVLGC